MNFIFGFLFLVNLVICSDNDESTTSLLKDETKDDLVKYEFDPNGYVIFCLCMGRFGNQAEHFLGSISFAKKLNRTFVVPPFITYKNVPYKEWFQLDKLNEFHRSISAEDFMQHIAPTHWPKGQRIGFCWLPSNIGSNSDQCKMLHGNPSTGFWIELGVDKFDKNIVYHFGFFDYEKWKSEFPASKYPVIALKGAPATFPMDREDRENQKYMIWSDNIRAQVDDYIKKTFDNQKFVGIHLRNGDDWSNACAHLDSNNYPYYMASPQCLEDTNKQVTKNLCFPNKETILKDLDFVLNKKLNGTVTNLYVATDKNPMISDIKNYFKKSIPNLNIVFQDPWLPIIDLAILARSEYFIGNCVSSFTSFVKRERDINNKMSLFWAITDY